MIPSKLIEYLDNELSTFCTSKPQYNIYRVGSSLFQSQIVIHDIDYLIIDENLNINYKAEIIRLKKKFSSKDFLSAAIDTFDPIIDQIFKEIEMRCRNFFSKRVVHEFGFGPIPMLDNNSITLHLSGPMNVKSFNLLFSYFPLHHLGFSRFHVRLGAKEFNEIIDPPEYGDAEIKEGMKWLISRATKTDCIHLKRQCLKRLKLIELLISNHHSPYVQSIKLTKPMSNVDVLKELEDYCD
jgi:hypothetical protein